MATADELLAQLPQKPGTKSADDLLASLPPKGGPSNAGLYDFGQKVQGMTDNVLGPINRISDMAARGASNTMFGTDRPVDAAQYLLGKANQGIQKVGEAVAGGTGYAAQRLVNVTGAGGQDMRPSDYAAALAGTAITQIPYLLGGGSEGANARVLIPRASAETAEGVAAAAKHGIPLTRAEITGSRPAAMTEVGLRSTPTGAIPFEAADKAQAASVASAEDAVRQKYGTTQPPSAVGMDAKIGLQKEMGANKAKAEALYKKIPDVAIETPNLQEHLNMSMLDADAVADPKVAKAVQRVRDVIERPAGPTEETFPESFGSKTMSKSIPGRTEGVGFTKRDIPASSQEVPLQSQYRVGPTTPEKAAPPTFQTLNKLRNDLSYQLKKETTWSPITGPQISPSGKKILAIKEALDKDISEFTTPKKLGSEAAGADLESKVAGPEFMSAFQKAKGFYGDYADLKNNKLVRKLGNAPESDMAKTIFGPGRAEDIRVAKSALGEDGFKSVQDQYFSDLLDEKNIGNKIGKLNEDFYQEALRPEQRQALKEVDAFRKRASGAQRLAGNNSRTAQTGATLATGAAMWNILKNAFVNPVMAIGHATEILGLPYAASKAYLGTGAGLELPTRVASRGTVPLLGNALQNQRRNQ